ncbi:MAG: beta-ketoacyl synthase chain length factor [Myxococcota bacterium]|nr:beta-ketoacyl synthase chain length factor [Myxococcota bacterium]
MIGLDLLGVAAWAPGLEDEEAWDRWSREPSAIGCEGVPAVDFLPPMVRRRCTPLTRMMMRAAFDGCPEALRSEVRTVFASRHGSINESLELLQRVVADKPLSPARFSHTVHNAQAGLFSIAAGNRAASSSLAAMEDGVAAAFVEAATHLDREPGRPVLVVLGDAPLSETFAPLVDEVQAAYAVAFVVATPEGEPALRVDFGPGDPDTPPPPWPQALELLRWLRGAEPELELRGPRSALRFVRGAGPEAEPAQV